MNYPHCERFKDYVKYQCDDSTMYEFDNGYGAIVEYNESVDNLWITIIKDIDGNNFNYAYPDFAHGFCRITGVETHHLFLWLRQIKEIKGGHKMTKLETLKQQTADLEAKLEESTAQLKEMKAEIDRLENGWEMKCPYKLKDEYWLIYSDGGVGSTFWFDRSTDKGIFDIGNAFQTEQAAELEAKRRNLLARFRAFRDECNGDWKAEFTNTCYKYFIRNYCDKLDTDYIWSADAFVLFGYFKNKNDALKAIDLFGDEIKELFVEGE